MKRSFSLAIAVVFFVWGGLAGTSFAVTQAYLTNSGTDTLSVVSTADHGIDYTVTVQDFPFGVAVSPGGAYVYVSNSESGTLSVIEVAEINTPDEPVVAGVGVGNDPRGVAVSPDGAYVYVANYQSDTVSVISTQSYTVSAEMTVDNGPFGIAVDPEDGDRVYVAQNAGNSLMIMTQDGNDTVSVTVGNQPLGVAVDPDGDFVYVANYGDGTLSVIAIEEDEEDDEEYFTATLVETVSVGSGPYGVAVADDGNTIFVTNSLDNTVTLIQAADFTVVATVAVGDTPLGVAAPQNGDFAYVVNNGEDSVTVVDTAGNVLETFSTGGGSAPVGFGAFIGGTRPEAPSELDIDEADEDSITLEWTDNSWDELGFKIERWDDDDDEYVLIAEVGSNVTEYKDNDVDSNDTYYYRVCAYNEAADSTYATVDGQTDDEDSSIACFIGTIDGCGSGSAQGWVAWLLVLTCLVAAAVRRAYRRS